MKRRFAKAMEASERRYYGAFHGPGGSKNEPVIAADITLEMYRQAPVVTEHMVRVVNQDQAAGWTAKNYPEFEDLSVSAAQNMMGLKIASSANFLQALADGLAFEQRAAERGTLNLTEGTLDWRDKSPECKDVVSHVR